MPHNVERRGWKYRLSPPFSLTALMRCTGSCHRSTRLFYLPTKYEWAPWNRQLLPISSSRVRCHLPNGIEPWPAAEQPNRDGHHATTGIVHRRDVSAPLGLRRYNAEPDKTRRRRGAMLSRQALWDGDENRCHRYYLLCPKELFSFYCFSLTY